MTIQNLEHLMYETKATECHKDHVTLHGMESQMENLQMKKQSTITVSSAKVPAIMVINVQHNFQTGLLSTMNQ